MTVNGTTLALLPQPSFRTILYVLFVPSKNLACAHGVVSVWAFSHTRHMGLFGSRADAGSRGMLRRGTLNNTEVSEYRIKHRVRGTSSRAQARLNVSSMSDSTGEMIYGNRLGCHRRTGSSFGYYVRDPTERLAHGGSRCALEPELGFRVRLLRQADDGARKKLYGGFDCGMLCRSSVSDNSRLDQLTGTSSLYACRQSCTSLHNEHLEYVGSLRIDVLIGSYALPTPSRRPSTIVRTRRAR
ncbi:hypothetical protein C8Q79DRAFT_456495 [Trametes meyenii]|nr:hypothetical protein C8Q79DRAFT_456495 [Trametes meyenii]